MYDPTALAQWKELQEHRADVARLHLRDLFRRDPDRAAAMTIEDCGLLLDYSKNRATGETMRLLLGLAERSCEWLHTIEKSRLRE